MNLGHEMQLKIENLFLNDYSFRYWDGVLYKTNYWNGGIFLIREKCQREKCALVTEPCTKWKYNILTLAVNLK